MQASFDDQSARYVLAKFAPHVRPVRVESLGNRGGFSGARIWRVVTDAGDFALRRWPNPGLPRARITGLHQLLEHLRMAGLAFVAVPLRTNDGTSLPHSIIDDWQLEPWLPGLADFHADPTNQRLRAAMVALAHWHLAAERFVPGAEAAQWFASRVSSPSPAVAERLAILMAVDSGQMDHMEKRIQQSKASVPREIARHTLALFQRGHTRVVAELQLVRDVAVRLQPCLRDVWHDHVLFSGNAVTGIIDPSACRTESVASDLSRLIGSLVKEDHVAWDFALAEYQRHRPLTANELTLVAVLDRSGVLLSGWTWLQWLNIERRPFADPEAVEKRLKEIIERMEKLFDGESINTTKFILP
jgi:Ser/Thr protein kinase RdoA (MazF antagonist)